MCLFLIDDRTHLNILVSSSSSQEVEKVMKAQLEQAHRETAQARAEFDKVCLSFNSPNAFRSQLAFCS
jgi:flagellar motor component MotA